MHEWIESVKSIMFSISTTNKFLYLRGRWNIVSYYTQVGQYELELKWPVKVWLIARIRVRKSVGRAQQSLIDTQISKLVVDKIIGWKSTKQISKK